MRFVKGIVLALALGVSVSAADDNDVTAFPEIKAADASKLPLPNGKSQIAIAETDKPLVKLQKARFNTALEEYTLNTAMIERGGFELSTHIASSEVIRTIASASHDVYSKVDVEKWLVWSVAAEKNLENTVAMRVAAGVFRKQELLTARRHRLEAEIALLKHRSTAANEATPKGK